MRYYNCSNPVNWSEVKELAKSGLIDKIIFDNNGQTYVLDLTAHPELDPAAKVELARTYFSVISMIQGT